MRAAQGRNVVGKVIDCNLPIDPKHADTISAPTDHLDIEIETYGDAAHAIRRWFATMQEPGARQWRAVEMAPPALGTSD